MRRKGRRAQSPSRVDRDAQYRQALGLDPTPPGAAARPARLPSAIGVQASAGASRGGRGAAHRGKGLAS